MTTNNNYNETTEPDITMTTATYIDCRRRPSSALAVVLEIVSVLLLLFIVLVDSGWFFISRASLRFARARIAYRRARIIWRINNETMTFNNKKGVKSLNENYNYI